MSLHYAFLKSHTVDRSQASFVPVSIENPQLGRCRSKSKISCLALGGGLGIVIKGHLTRTWPAKFTVPDNGEGRWPDKR